MDKEANVSLPVSEMESVIIQLNSEVDTLDKLSSKLMARLEPILGGENPKETASTLPPEASCPLSRSIEEIAITANGLGHRVSSVIDRLKI